MTTSSPSAGPEPLPRKPAPPAAFLSRCRSASLRSDMLAGLALAAVAIPQCMGYTKIAGTPVVTGLYTILLPILAFALLGSPRHLVVGADSATAAVFFSGLQSLARPFSAQRLALSSAAALRTAGFLAAWLRRLVEPAPHPVRWLVPDLVSMDWNAWHRHLHRGGPGVRLRLCGDERLRPG